MNRIPRPTYGDGAALTNLANNHLVDSYPKILPALPLLQQAYVDYLAAAGNVFNVPVNTIAAEVCALLKGHYKSPPSDIQHINIMRELKEHRVCPMCGSFHRGTLDHLLPQSQYPHLTIFSMNLVPACKCNSKRQNVIKGPGPSERILHPYFDDCLAERLVAAEFTDLGLVPRIRLRLSIGRAHPKYAAIRFHFRTIVERTAVRGYLRDRWTDLCRKPALAIRALQRNPSSLVGLTAILEEELDFLDETHRGKNNWDSIFVAGLLDSHVQTWLHHRMNRVGRLPNGSLI